MYKYIVVLLAILSSLSLSAQKGVEFGAYVGMNHYFGDLNTDFDLMHPSYATGLMTKYVVNDRIALSLRTGIGEVRGNDLWQKNERSHMRGLSFRTKLIDITPEVEFNFSPYVHGDPIYKLAPYLALGGTIFKYTPEAKETLSGETFSLRSIHSEGKEYSTWSGGVNATVGFKYYLGNKWTLTGFLTARLLMTDYLDDVSSTYSFSNINSVPDPIDAWVGEYGSTVNTGSLDLSGSDLSRYILYSLIDPSVNQQQFTSLTDVENYVNNRQHAQRGDYSIYDSYSTFGIGITYFFGKEKCPEPF